jgi:NTP pyrophosphatase (non-canonical NTP hydrolase)
MSAIMNATAATDDAARGLLTMNAYQRHTRATDQNTESGPRGLRVPLLGLFGEVGSLLSALKKKRRDVEAYTGYEDAILEEFGDVLWYFANIAARAGLELSVLAQRLSRGIEDWDEVQSDEFGTFGDIQSKRAFYGPLSNEEFEIRLIEVAGKVGCLLNDVAREGVRLNRDLLSTHLVEILRAILAAAEDADIELQEAARRNVSKTLSRWPSQRTYGALFDLEFDADEQLPRRIEMHFQEMQKGSRVYVLQRCNGIIIGDRLTDNKSAPDDYRFHDVFHLAYAAILGWSPVLRALFKVKRKSRPDFDENQDGARAILIEEGVSTYVFNHALRLNLFSDTRKLDYALLKTIQDLVRGFEIEARPLWQWEEAILEGYRVFRELKTSRAGAVVADLNARSLEFRRD